jgi:hypothetical protein
MCVCVCVGTMLPYKFSQNSFQRFIICHRHRIAVVIRPAFICFHGSTAPSGSRPPRYQGFKITLSYTHQQSVGILWTSDQSDADTSTWQHTTLRRERHLYPRRDSNPQSQQTNGHRPMPRSSKWSLYIRLPP